jgi:hypothetical protein
LSPERRRLARFFVVGVLCLVSSGVFSGCGYALAGRGSFLPDYIRTIGIPMFANQTPIFNLEIMITQKVRSEFIGRGRYQVVPDQSNNVDAVLTGRVLSAALTPTAFNAQQLATSYMLTIITDVQLRDMRANKVLWEDPALVFRQEYAAQGGQTAVDASAYFTEDQSALDRMTTEFSRAVVSAILEAF